MTEFQTIRHFVGVDLNEGSAPESTTMVRFRNLLNEHNLARAILEEVNASLAGSGLIMRQGTVFEAIIAAPSSVELRRVAIQSGEPWLERPIRVHVDEVGGGSAVLSDENKLIIVLKLRAYPCDFAFERAPQPSFQGVIPRHHFQPSKAPKPFYNIVMPHQSSRTQSQSAQSF